MKKLFISLFLLINSASAEPYLLISFGETIYNQDRVWAQEGYDQNTTQPKNFSFGAGNTINKFLGAEIAYFDMGEYSRRNLWGSPDLDPNVVCNSCFPTHVADQKGRVRGGSVSIIPKYSIGNLSIQAPIGVTYYNAQWSGAFVYLDGSETYQRSLRREVNMNTHSFGATSGFGVAYKLGNVEIGLEYRFHPGMSVDGKEFKNSFSGGGGYKDVETFNLVLRVLL
jgi:hypothetical protein